ncbi:hypothetical protein M422DRAFT_75853 [Sphaerobolus stellatus SS14]|uniref:RPA43 OB domain-containing protein n=1 Tax=Sphaerobolus stellatus (strain SS14) TaxID=990650 RepID=A0A0C9U8W3_SPHS4|nr:hypothetical protein M422DRAFT_75853 [Sphaerobolus stellatus SS14]
MTAVPSSPPKKRKHRDDDPISGPSTKKSKKDKKKKHHNSEFALIHASLVVSIPPVFASSPAQGIEEMLDSLVMRYIPTFRGVVLTHSNLKFLQSTARIQDDCPFASCKVGFDALVWSPKVGQQLTGQVILCSPDHVSLLVHRTFNVSIPRHHLPSDEWEFEYGPAENDPEFGTAAFAAAAEKDGDIEMDGDEAKKEAAEGDVAEAVEGEFEDELKSESQGQWMHKQTGKALGPTVEFTVIGLTIANQMLSLIGSIQTDPFSPSHVPTSSHPITKSKSKSTDEKEDDEEEQDLMAQLEEEDTDSELEDGAELLARLARKTEKDKVAKEKKKDEKGKKDKEKDKDGKKEKKEKKEKEKQKTTDNAEEKPKRKKKTTEGS